MPPRKRAAKKQNDKPATEPPTANAVDAQETEEQQQQSLRRRNSSRRKKRIWGVVSILALVVAVICVFFWPEEGNTGCPYLDDPKRWHDWCPSWCTWCPAGGHHAAAADASDDSDSAQEDTARRAAEAIAADADTADADAPAGDPAFREFTVAELARHDGTDDSLPLLLAINHEVFDVGAGARFYEVGAGYHQFAGRDSSRALALGSLEEKDLTDDVADFTAQQRDYLREQVLFYRGKYPRVGTLVDASLGPLPWDENSADAKQQQRIEDIKKEAKAEIAAAVQADVERGE